MIIVNSYLKKKSFFWIRTAGSKSLRRYLTLSVLRNTDLNDPEFGNVFADCKLLIFYRLGYVLSHLQYTNCMITGTSVRIYTLKLLIGIITCCNTNACLFLSVNICGEVHIYLRSVYNNTCTGK